MTDSPKHFPSIQSVRDVLVESLRATLLDTDPTFILDWANELPENAGQTKDNPIIVTSDLSTERALRIILNTLSVASKTLQGSTFFNIIDEDSTVHSYEVGIGLIKTTSNSERYERIIQETFKPNDYYIVDSL